MASIFVSYNRHSAALVRTLVEDVEVLGHTVWFDQELTGGQTWWDQILANIRACDLFLFVLDPSSLESTACTREYTYAAQLRKTVLPVLVADGVAVGLLPDELSRVQYVDMRSADRAAALRLARALGGVPSAGPLPDPLPAPPDVPLSYLACLGRLVDGAAPLTYEQQSALVIDVRKALRDPGTRDAARVLMERLRKRRDLLASIADEMREISNDTSLSVPAPACAAPLPSASGPAITRPAAWAAAVVDGLTVAPGVVDEGLPGLRGSGMQEEPTVGDSASWQRRPKPIRSVRFRARNALVGAIVGTAIGVAAMNTASDAPWELGFLTGAGGALAAAIAGNRYRTILVALKWAVMTWVGFVAIERATGETTDNLFAAGGVVLAPIACVVAAAVHVVVRKIRHRRGSGEPARSAQPA
jgi:hypothetical protein